MKKIFTLLFAMFIGSMFAQVAITPGTLSLVTPEDAEYVYNLTVTNSGTSPATVWWKVDKATSFPAEWSTYVCDANLCYPPGTDVCAPSKGNVIEAGKSVVFTMHFNPNSKIGASKMSMQLYSDKSLKTLIYETDKNANVVADKLLSTKAVTNADIKIYPNPTDDYFTIKNDAGVAKVGIYNIVGKEVDVYRHVSGTSYNVSDYARGIYIVRLIDNRGKTIKSIKLAKSGTRP